MLSVKASVFQRNFFPHPLLMTLFTTETNHERDQRKLTVYASFVIAPSTNLVLGIFSLRNEVNNPGHQELTQADISNVDTCVCYFAGPSSLLLSVFTRLVTKTHYPARPVRLGSCGLSDACLGYVTEMLWSWRPGKKLYRDKAMSSHHRIFTWANTVNDLINARGVYLILRVQAGAFNRWKAFKTERGVYSDNYNKHNKTSMFSAKKSREFKNRGISTPSVDTSRPSNHPYRFFKFQHRC